MLWQRMLLALQTIEVLAVGTSRNRIVVPEQPSCPKLWKQQVDNVLERLREENISLEEKLVLSDSGVRFTHKVETINISLVDPFLETVSHLRGCANQKGTVSSKANVLGHGVLGPLGVGRRELGISFNS